jgi:predicted transcriptional regulator
MISMYSMTEMVRPKDEVRRILENVPDDASFEDIQYRIYVCQRIKRGLKDMDEDRLLTQNEVERRMARWLAR